MWFYHSRTFKSRRVEKNNGKMLQSAINNTRESWGHSVRLSYFYIFDLISFMLFHFTIFWGGGLFPVALGVAVGKFLSCNMSVFVLCYAMLDALDVYGVPRRQTGLTENLLLHSLNPITWLYMTLRYLWHRCFCLWALCPSLLFPANSLCSLSFQILESELWDHVS